MNNISPKKLLYTKWTACQPANKEKHFLVTVVHRDEEDVPQSITLEAVYSKSERVLNWRELQDASIWQIGWQ